MTEFRVYGTPAPKGSKKGFYRGGHVVLVEQSKNAKPWEQAVHWAARECGGEVKRGPITVGIIFLMPRTGSVSKKQTNVLHQKRPDLDKLVRCTWDGLTGICFNDDSEIAFLLAKKRYCNLDESPGALIRVEIVENFGEMELLLWLMQPHKMS
jgi:crossover junction endodeoxyribonuclease RusA